MRYQKMVCCLVMTVALSITAIGQSRKVTEKDIDELVANARAARIGTSFRETNSSLIFTNNDPKPETSSYSVADFESGKNSHIVAEQNYNGKKIRTETITIGRLRYKRVDNSDWTKEDLDAPKTTSTNGMGNGTGSGTVSSPPEIELTCSYVGAEKIGDICAEVYQKVKTVTFNREKGKLVRTVITKYWFDQGKRLIKYVNDDKFKGNPKLYRMMTEYDYQTAIKIQAPVK